MIELDFRLQPSDRRDVDLAAAEEWVLRYDLFLGDIVFRTVEWDASTSWGWVPILDFALGLRSIVDDLEGPASRSAFEFTESDATIEFRREGNEVWISASYAAGEVSAPLSDLTSAVHGFLRRVLTRLVDDDPRLAENPVVSEQLLR